MNRVESLIVGLTLLSWFLYSCRDDIKAWWRRRVEANRSIASIHEADALRRAQNLVLPRVLPDSPAPTHKAGRAASGVDDLTPEDAARRRHPSARPRPAWREVVRGPFS